MNKKLNEVIINMVIYFVSDSLFFLILTIRNAIFGVSLKISKSMAKLGLDYF